MSAKIVSKQLGRLMVLMVVAWGLILTEGSIFFFVIRPTLPNIHKNFVSSVLKISSVGLFAIVWVAVLFSLEYLFFRRSRAN